MVAVPLFITKRDGSQQPYDGEKIRQAILKAYRAVGLHDEAQNAIKIEASIHQELAQEGACIAVEAIQDLVYREWRTVEREKRTSLKKTMDGIVSIEKNDVNLGNANMSAYTP